MCYRLHLQPPSWLTTKWVGVSVSGPGCQLRVSGFRAYRPQAGRYRAEGHGGLPARPAGACAPVPHPVRRQEVPRPVVAPPPEWLQRNTQQLTCQANRTHLVRAACAEGRHSTQLQEAACKGLRTCARSFSNTSSSRGPAQQEAGAPANMTTRVAIYQHGSPKQLLLMRATAEATSASCIGLSMRTL